MPLIFIIICYILPIIQIYLKLLYNDHDDILCLRFMYMCVNAFSILVKAIQIVNIFFTSLFAAIAIHQAKRL